MNDIYSLGFSAFYHDAAAAIIKNGEIIAATHEERFTRIKHDKSFPINSINYCLESANVNPSDINAFVYYDSPVLTLDRILSNSVIAGKKSNDLLKGAIDSFFQEKTLIPDIIKEHFGSLGKEKKLLFVEHHMAHAAAAFYPSPFKEAAILTIDGVGEWSTTSIGLGQGKNITINKEIRYPHSLGLLYSAFTSYCGFKVNTGEYKLMGLAPYGEPKFKNLIMDKIIDIKEDGSFKLNMDYFAYMYDNKMTNENFHNLFKAKPRELESKLSKHYLDVAASIQSVTEEVVLLLAKHAKRSYGCDNLVMAGGVALNCVANGKLIKKNIFNKIWIQPAAGDAGSSIGAALLSNYHYFNLERKILDKGKDSMKGSRLGPIFSKEEILAYLSRHEIPYQELLDNTKASKIIANEINNGNIIGLFQGKMEFGPRALGSRSILGDARDDKTQSKMNLKIKYRESFRPFAPMVMYDKVSEYFSLDSESPYMLIVSQVNSEKTLAVSEIANDSIYDIVNQKRSSIPAVTHVDYSARVQTVHPNDDEYSYNILKSFFDLTGCPVLVNTSFNVRGEPIVCSPDDAFRCFMSTEMDILVLENILIYKKQLPEELLERKWGRKYDLD